MNSTALDPTLIADFDFIETKLPAIEGWLEPPAAQLTAFLLREQLSQAIAGPVLEIGVWRGKYLSVMFLCSVGKVIGVDIFQYGNTEAEIYELFGSLFADSKDRLSLIRSSSQDLDGGQLRQAAGGNTYSFISIDGGHTATAVCNDLITCESVLGPRGIIAIDDFLNPMAIGVSEGTYRYFLNSDNNLVPFAWCANKLFVCRRACAGKYADMVLEFINKFPTIPVSKRFLELRQNGDHWVNQDLLGGKCLILG